jgi:hypothetical protein
MNKGLHMSPFARTTVRLCAVALALTTATAATLYAGFMIVWMHAPAVSATAWAAALSALPLAASVGLWFLVRPAGRGAGNRPE